MKKFISIATCFTLLFCESKDFYKTPTFSLNNNLNAVIEIPAGTNKKIEYNFEKEVFEVDKKNGKERVIDFLPYLGNYGYVPSTYSDPLKGGDGDALDILVLSESVSTGTIIEVIPIAMLKLIDEDELDYKIIAIPVEIENRIININSFTDLKRNYREVMQIIELWFLNYNKEDKAEIKGWADKQEALKEINNNLKT